MRSPRKAYRPIPVEDVDDAESSDKLSSPLEAFSSRRSEQRRWPWFVHLGIISLYTLAFLTISVRYLDQKQENLEELCLLKQSMPSPAHEVVEYSTVRFNGSLDYPSPYSGRPSPALEEAWDRITMNNSLWPIRITDEDLRKINKSGRPSNVRYRESDGGGNMGSIEVFHQLHCLNMLRKYTYPKEYPEIQELWKTRPKFIRSHLDHCIEMIRQNLMCISDVGVISYDWVVGYEVPFPDFNTYHKCRNFDAILDWTKRNHVRIPREHMGRQGNETNLPKPPL